MKRILLITIVLLNLSDVFASREIIDLNENWYFQSPYQVWSEGVRPRWGKFTNVDLPHDFSIAQPFDKNCVTGTSGGYLPGGTAIYRKEDLFIPDTWKGKRVYLEFDGVYQNSEVFVNGVRVGKRPNGWISFGYDITRWLDFGKTNMLSVKVDNSLHLNCRWYSGSGIYRPVRLVVTDPLHISHNGGVFVSTPEISAEKTIVKIASSIINEEEVQKKFTIQYEIADVQGKIVARGETKAKLKSGEEKTFSQEIGLSNPLLWDLDTPNLYVLKTKVLSDNQLTDEKSVSFGVRSIRFDADKGFFLNEKNVKIKGVCIHHDAGMLGSAVPRGVLERRIKILKEMGCNAIRTSHNPFDPEFYEICDRLGMLVMNEIFDEWTVPTTSRVPYGSNLFWDEWHERDLRDFLMRDRNHPSVIIWSIGNELTEQFFPEGKEIAEKLVKICHELDPTRSVTTGNNAMPEANRTGMADAVDVAGYNYGPQFGLYEKDRLKYPERKFIATESTRGNSTRGYYSFPVPEDGLLQKTPDMYYSSYDGITRKYGMEHEWKVTKDLDYISGMFIWTGFDYIGETDYPWPSKYCNFGAIDACGFPKDAFWFYKSQWDEKNDVLHLLPHWNWEGREGEITPVWCYTNCDEVELFLNGKSLGKRNFANTNKLRLEWNDVKYEKGELRAIGYRKGVQVVQKKVETTGEPYTFKIETDKSILQSDNQDVVHLTISVVDKNGLPVPNANTTFNLKLSGNAKLLGIDNGDPLFVGDFKQTDNRTLFNGLALAILQSTRKQGVVEVEVSGGNLQSSLIKIDVCGAGGSRTLVQTRK